MLMARTLSHTTARHSRRVASAVSLALFVVSLVAVGGCGGPKDGANSVNGKITYKGSAVAGIVGFVYADGKTPEASGPINAADGSYNVVNAAPGKVKVVVRPMPGATLVPMGKGDVTAKDGPATSGGGVAPPQKFQNAATTTLEYEVKAGKQEKNFTLD